MLLGWVYSPVHYRPARPLLGPGPVDLYATSLPLLGIQVQFPNRQPRKNELSLLRPEGPAMCSR